MEQKTRTSNMLYYSGLIAVALAVFGHLVGIFPYEEATYYIVSGVALLALSRDF